MPIEEETAKELKALAARLNDLTAELSALKANNAPAVDLKPLQDEIAALKARLEEAKQDADAEPALGFFGL